MSLSVPSLVSTQWLADHLADPEIAVLDASKHLPAAGRDPHAEFEEAHIPGARFLDLASLKDTGSNVPDAIPTVSQLVTRLAELGVSPNHA
ncbi:MAG: sulfurtransferase, partial [Erythrobacter sp.]|nr:sulfurtransferase [Erythrobacter sp.]